MSQITEQLVDLNSTRDDTTVVSSVFSNGRPDDAIVQYIRSLRQPQALRSPITLSPIRYPMIELGLTHPLPIKCCSRQPV